MIIKLIFAFIFLHVDCLSDTVVNAHYADAAV